MFSKILIIDNDEKFANILKINIENTLSANVNIVNNLEAVIDDLYEYDFYAIRCDKKTQDIIKNLSNKDKFIILLTNNDKQEVREKILAYGVSDYVITSSLISTEFVAKIIKRLDSNAQKTILCVDDSKIVLTQISFVLETQNINYIQCSNGEDALKYLNDPKSKKIDLVVTDYEMPQMNGYELVKIIRTKHSFEELPVLVLSGTEDTYMISRFLKIGANDYITKPFITEEFLGRITNALLVSEMFSKIKLMAMTDHLTSLPNRTYFYEAGISALELQKRLQHPISIAMLDIDNFKKINDTYGHEIGDKALIHISNTIKKSLRRTDIFVRFGGEEFVILLPNCPHNEAMKVMNKICESVSSSPLLLSDNKKLTMTISIGVTSIIEDNVDNMIERADKYMYTAKLSGKNQVFSEE